MMIMSVTSWGWLGSMGAGGAFGSDGITGGAVVVFGGGITSKNSPTSSTANNTMMSVLRSSIPDPLGIDSFTTSPLA
jgi:hypothetical protein